MTIPELIKQLANDPSAEIYTQVGTVESVDESKRICDVKLVHSEITVFECRLQSEIETDKGIVTIPKKDSFVLVTWLAKNHAFVSAFSEIEKVIVDFPKVDGTVDEIKIKDTKITLNDGNNDGIVKIKPLVDKINALENLVNNLLTTLKSTTIPLAPSGTYPFASLYSGFNAITPTTQKSDLENTDIKH